MESADGRDNTRSFFVPAVGLSIGHYKLITRLGSGGMGDVFLAEDSTLNRKVAIKFLSQQLCDDSEAKNRFVREAQAAAALNHPNIVTIYEVTEYSGRPYIAMEHVEGRTLKEILKEDLPLNRVIEIAIQLCDGLQKAHQAGVVHRDVKPANIVVDNDGRPKLLDFGLATVKGSDSITRAGSTLGTIAYMSPEQAQGKAVDHRSDIFSLGIMLYEMITKRQPFGRETDAATLGAIIYDTPDPISNFRSDISTGLQNLIEHALDKDLETRYQSASGLMADLKREKKALDGISGAHSTQSTRAIKPMKKSKLPLILSTTGAVAVVLLLLILKPWNLSIVADQQAQAADEWLAVMYFENLTDPSDQQRLGEIVTNLLISDLSEVKSIKVVSSQRLYDLLKQLGKEGERRIDRDMSSQVAKKASARWMITGSILQVEPEIIMTSQLIDVASGGVLASQRINGEPGEKIFPLTEKLAEQIRADRSFPREGADASHADFASSSTTSPEAYRYYLEGIEYQNRFFNTEARGAFKHAVQIDSTFAVAWMRLAQQLSGQEWQAARDKAERFMNFASPRDRVMIQAYLAQANGDNKTSGDLMREAAARYPDDKEILYSLAVSYSNIDERQLAITTLHRALELDPGFKTGWNQLAYVFMRHELPDSALRAVNKYIELAPDEPNPYDSKGDILAYLGQLDSAIVYYNRALEIRPEFTMQTVTKLGIANMLQQNYDEAGRLFRKAMGSSNSIERQLARTQWVNLLIYQGRLKEALAANRNALDADRLEGLGAESLARVITESRIHFHLGDVKKAWEVLEPIRTYDDKNDTYKMSLYDRAPITHVWYLATLGRDEEALKLIDSVRTETKTKSDADVVADRMQAVYSWVKGDYKKAVDLYKSVDAKQATFVSKFELARAYVDGGYFAEAAELLRKTSLYYDDIRFKEAAIYNNLLSYYLGRTNEGIGNNKEAIKNYESFLDIWKKADPEIKELIDGRKRLAALKSQA